MRACVDAPIGVRYDKLGAGEAAEPATASLSGRYFCDDDGDGLDSDGDPAVVGLTVTLLSADGEFVASTTTDTNGNYSFGDLTAGTTRSHLHLKLEKCSSHVAWAKTVA